MRLLRFLKRRPNSFRALIRPLLRFAHRFAARRSPRLSLWRKKTRSRRHLREVPRRSSKNVISGTSRAMISTCGRTRRVFDTRPWIFQPKTWGTLCRPQHQKTRILPKASRYSERPCIGKIQTSTKRNILSKSSNTKRRKRSSKLGFQTFTTATMWPR